MICNTQRWYSRFNHDWQHRDCFGLIPYQWQDIGSSFHPVGELSIGKLKTLFYLVFESPVHRTEKKPQTRPDCNWFEPDHRLQLQQLSYQSSFSFSVFEILQNRRKTGLNRLQPVFLLFCTSHQLPLYIGSTATKKSPKSVKIWLSYNQNNFHQYWQPNPVQDFIVSQSFLIRFT